MAVRLSGAIIIISVICSFFTNKTEALTSAALEGGTRAVTVAFSLISLMCLWCGIMRVAEKIGFTALLTRLFSPLFRLVFPSAYKNRSGIDQLSAAFTANLLGLGNGATPLALNAIKHLPKGKNGAAGNDAVTFTVLSCACPCIFPTTVVSLRAAAGSNSPASIVPLVWICSVILFMIGAVICRIMGGKEE